MIVAVQTIGSLKRGLIAAVGAGFFRHGLAESLHGTAKMFRDGDGGVVVRFQHEGVKQVGQKKLAARFCTQMDFRS